MTYQFPYTSAGSPRRLIPLTLKLEGAPFWVFFQRFLWPAKKKPVKMFTKQNLVPFALVGAERVSGVEGVGWNRYRDFLKGVETAACGSRSSMAYVVLRLSILLFPSLLLISRPLAMPCWTCSTRCWCVCTIGCCHQWNSVRGCTRRLVFRTKSTSIPINGCLWSTAVQSDCWLYSPHCQKLTKLWKSFLRAMLFFVWSLLSLFSFKN